MQFTTEIRSGDFPLVYARFEQIIGSSVWHRRVAKIRAEMRGNPYLREYLIAENRIAFALDRLSMVKKSSGSLPAVQITDSSQYEAVAFVSQIISFLDSVDEWVARAFVGRARGAFANPADFRGLACEMLIATHMQRRGVTIRLPHDGTYDWLAEKDGLQFEVECKSISGDKGRQIHLRESLDFCHLAQAMLGRAIDSVADGLFVTVQLPGPVPAAYHARKEIAAQAKLSVLTAKDARSDIAQVSQAAFRRCEISGEGEIVDRERLRSFLTQRLGQAHGYQAVAHATRSGGIVVIALGSLLPDDMIGETMQTLEKAASQQLTGARPGMLCAKFEGLTADELVEIARSDEPPTALRIGVHKLWRSRAMERVTHVAFVADGNVAQRASGAWSRLGASYVFENPQSDLRDDIRLKLFD